MPKLRVGRISTGPNRLSCSFTNFFNGPRFFAGAHPITQNSLGKLYLACRVLMRLEGIGNFPKRHAEPDYRRWCEVFLVFR